MATESTTADMQEGINSILDTDLYKLTMQCAVLRSFPDAEVTYSFTNRTPDLKFTRRGFEWLKEKVNELSELQLTPIELGFLKSNCYYLPPCYLTYLYNFRFRPREHLKLTFTPVDKSSLTEKSKEEGHAGFEDGELGDVAIDIRGKWVETILYEIPLLVLISECYFKFSSTDWNYDGQFEKAYEKGIQLLNAGCALSEFGTRRRRSYYTQKLVIEGLIRAGHDYEKNGGKAGKFVGTSNVHFAETYGLNPVGTVAHEWFMGIAAITGDYQRANEIGLRDWVATFGEGVLGIALTDTFGTEQFLKCFSKKYEAPPSPSPAHNRTHSRSFFTHSHKHSQSMHPPAIKTYAEIFQGIRQDSGDPAKFVETMRKFYDKQGIKDKKMIVFSDSLDTELCLKYKALADKEGFTTSFGVGTFLTNDFNHVILPHKKSVPMNIVIKLSSANGNPAVKISDNIGKNTGDKETLKKVKEELGYVEKEYWEGGDERNRWSGKEETTKVAA